MGLLLMVISMTLSAQDFSADRGLFEAYQREDMSVWEEYLGNRQPSAVSHQILIYEYGYCGYIVAEAKKEGKEALLPEAKRYVQQFRSDVEAAKGSLPAGHYEMYMSAVMVYEMRLHIAIRPVKAMSLAKEATISTQRSAGIGVLRHVALLRSGSLWEQERSVAVFQASQRAVPRFAMGVLLGAQGNGDVY